MKCSIFVAAIAAMSLAGTSIADVSYGIETFDDYATGATISEIALNEPSENSSLGTWGSGSADMSSIVEIEGSGKKLKLDTEGDVVVNTFAQAEQINADLNGLDGEAVDFVLSGDIRFVTTEEIETDLGLVNGDMPKFALYALEQEMIEVTEQATGEEDPETGSPIIETIETPYTHKDLVLFHGYKNGDGTLITTNSILSSVNDFTFTDEESMPVVFTIRKASSGTFVKVNVSGTDFWAPTACTKREIKDAGVPNFADDQNEGRIWFRIASEDDTISSINFSGTGTVDSLSAGNSAWEVTDVCLAWNDSSINAIRVSDGKLFEDTADPSFFVEPGDEVYFFSVDPDKPGLQLSGEPVELVEMYLPQIGCECPVYVYSVTDIMLVDAIDGVYFIDITAVEPEEPAPTIITITTNDRSYDRGDINLPEGDILTGNTFDVTVTADDGYVISQISTNGVPVDGAFGKATFTFTADFGEDDACNISAAYAKNSAWFLDPFVRNTFETSDMVPGVQSAFIDEDAGIYVPSLSNQEEAGVAMYNIAALRDGVAMQLIDPDYYEAEPRGTDDYWSRSIARVAGYNAFVSGNYINPNIILVSPYTGPWAGEGSVGYGVALSNLPEDVTSLKLDPIAVNEAGTYLYGRSGNYIYQFAIAAEEDDSTKIGSFNYVKRFESASLLGKGLRGIGVGTFGGNDIVYCADYDGKKLLAVNTTFETVSEIASTSSKSYNVEVVGMADGTPRLILSGATTVIFDLSDDGSLISSTPIVSLDTNSYFMRTSGDGRFSNAFAADESNAFLAARANDNIFALAVLEKKPENLIVRASFNGGETMDDRLVVFGNAASETFTAPEGFEITSVSVNGLPVSDFVQAAGYTYEADSLEEYVYIEMTTIAVTSASYEADDEIAYGGEPITLTSEEAAWLNGFLEAGSLDKVAYTSALNAFMDNVDLKTKYILNIDPLKDSEYEFVVTEIVPGDAVAITVKLIRTEDGYAVRGAINGKVKLLGRETLGGEFAEIEAPFDDDTFATNEEAKITLEGTPYKFFKAVIE